MKHVNIVVGRPYAVTTTEACTITSAEGLIIASCEPGEQAVFVAPCDVVRVSADAAHLTETTGSALSALAGGRAKRALRAYIEEKSSELGGELELLRESVTGAAEMSQHISNTSIHQPASTAYNALVDVLNAACPVGRVIAMLSAATPDGYLLCDGSEVQSADYPELAAALGESGSSFALPDLRGRTLWGADAAVEGQTPGSVMEAGLPNIEGGFTAFGGETSHVSGAFNIEGTNDAVPFSGSTWKTSFLSFDASLSDSIYGNSDTVQPPAIAVNWFIRALPFAQLLTA